MNTWWLHGGGEAPKVPKEAVLERRIAETFPDRAKVCFIGAASGDSPGAIESFYRAYGSYGFILSEFPVFPSLIVPLEHLMEQDVIVVGGGSTFNLITLLRAHGIDQVLKQLTQRGCTFVGTSAGMNVWFNASITATFHPYELRVLEYGLGLLEGVGCPHANVPERYELFLKACAGGAENATVHIAENGHIEAGSVMNAAGRGGLGVPEGSMVRINGDTGLIEGFRIPDAEDPYTLAPDGTMRTIASEVLEFEAQFLSRTTDQFYRPIPQLKKITQPADPIIDRPVED